LNQLLGKVVTEDHRDWDEHLPFVMAAYRATKHDATGFTPNLLFLGREINFPIDLMYGTPANPEVQSYGEFVQKRCEKIEKAYVRTRTQLDVSATRNKRRYDLKVRPKQFEVGLWVWYFCPRRRPGRDPKWQKLYDGPFLLIDFIGEVNVVLQRTEKSKKFVTHIDKIKVCLGETPKSWLSKSKTRNKDIPVVDVDVQVASQTRVDLNVDTDSITYADVDANYRVDADLEDGLNADIDTDGDNDQVVEDKRALLWGNPESGTNPRKWRIV